MRRFTLPVSLAALILFACSRTAAAQSNSSSVSLADVAWPQAQALLTEDAVVVIAVGNASKAHGPHLPLSSDFIQADYVKEQLARRTRVIVAPSVGYGFYPPFIEYPGSTTLPLSVSRDMVANICRSYARNSMVRRFYIVSHGNITNPVYRQAAEQLRAEGILLRHTDWEAGKAAGKSAVAQQERGSHADEVETSMLLYIAPASVDMTRAVKEDGGTEDTAGRMIGNRPENNGVFSPSGVYGDPTIATKEKGRRITEGLIEAAVRDVEALRSAPLPRAEPEDGFFTGLPGEYAIAPGDSVTIARDGMMLVVERTGRPRVRLQRVAKYRFGLWTTEARFFADAAGNVTDVMLSSDGHDVLARRIK